MRHPLPFDTHAYIKRLIAAGMPEAQADVQAEALSEIVLSQLATKDDLQAVEGVLQRDLQAVKNELGREIDSLLVELHREIDSLRTELKADLQKSELRLGAKIESELRKQMVWFFGMLVVLVGALVALLRGVSGLP